MDGQANISEPAASLELGSATGFEDESANIRRAHEGIFINAAKTVPSRQVSARGQKTLRKNAGERHAKSTSKEAVAVSSKLTVVLTIVLVVCVGLCYAGGRARLLALRKETECLEAECEEWQSRIRDLESEIEEAQQMNTSNGLPGRSWGLSNRARLCI